MQIQISPNFQISLDLELPAGRPEVSFSGNNFSFSGRFSLGLAGGTSDSESFFGTAGAEEFLRILLGLTWLFLRIPFTSGFLVVSSKKSLGKESERKQLQKNNYCLPNSYTPKE